MKITIAKDETTVRTQDVPVGQVFRGTVIGPNSGRRVTGVFYKAQGPWRDSRAEDYRDMVLVRLDEAGSHTYADGRRHANIAVINTVIYNYEPLEAEVVARRA